MTKFEKDTLYTLLEMYKKELNERGYGSVFGFMTAAKMKGDTKYCREYVLSAKTAVQFIADSLV